MQGAETKESLVSELETLKQMRHDMGRCLEVMQFARKDLETVTDNLEMLEALNKDWCHLCEKGKRITNKNVQKKH